MSKMNCSEGCPLSKPFLEALATQAFQEGSEAQGVPATLLLLDLAYLVCLACLEDLATQVEGLQALSSQDMPPDLEVGEELHQHDQV